jgi:hypothetical protein
MMAVDGVDGVDGTNDGAFVRPMVRLTVALVRLT